jgi:hypothetical protein
VELFFRWHKCTVGLKHFFSESQNGTALQVYIAVIGTLLITIEADAQPSKHEFAQMSLVACGMVSLADAKKVMQRRREMEARAAEKQKQRRAGKKIAQQPPRPRNDASRRPPVRRTPQPKIQHRTPKSLRNRLNAPNHVMPARPMIRCRRKCHTMSQNGDNA